MKTKKEQNVIKVIALPDSAHAIINHYFNLNLGEKLDIGRYEA